VGTRVRRCALAIAIAIAMLGATPTGAAQLQPVLTERIRRRNSANPLGGDKLLIGPNDIVVELGRSVAQHDGE